MCALWPKTSRGSSAWASVAEVDLRSRSAVLRLMGGGGGGGGARCSDPLVSLAFLSGILGGHLTERLCVFRPFNIFPLLLWFTIANVFSLSCFIHYFLLLWLTTINTFSLSCFFIISLFFVGFLQLTHFLYCVFYHFLLLRWLTAVTSSLLCFFIISLFFFGFLQLMHFFLSCFIHHLLASHPSFVFCLFVSRYLVLIYTRTSTSFYFTLYLSFIPLFLIRLPLILNHSLFLHPLPRPFILLLSYLHPFLRGKKG